MTKTNIKPKFDDILVAKQVLAQEIKGLEELEASIGAEFATVIEAIAASNGRVIITGMGKSGHIGKKIAATLASTGTASMYVHPAEASHGDLGMITKEDIVIALSNSGETAELKDIVSYCKRFDIFLVAMVRNANSTLVKCANVAIILPNTKEANEINAPTTSTTQMIAYGDAIAMALINRRGFSKEHFGVLHPGGKLGAQLMKVEDIMYSGKKVPVSKAEDLMSKVLLEITEKGFGCVAVTGIDGKVLGVITDGDLRRHMDSDIVSKTAQEVMTKNPITIDKSMLLAEALNIMNNKSITSLIVTEEGRPEGIVHIHDCLRVGIV